jgi:hypothetical protein
MRVVEPFTKQHPQTPLGADLRMMHSLKADEATIRGEEVVGIGTRQTREHIKVVQFTATKTGGEKRDLGKNSTQWTLW